MNHEPQISADTSLNIKVRYATREVPSENNSKSRLDVCFRESQSKAVLNSRAQQQAGFPQSVFQIFETNKRFNFFNRILQCYQKHYTVIEIIKCYSIYEDWDWMYKCL